jgi:hypothetical protein
LGLPIKRHPPKKEIRTYPISSEEESMPEYDFKSLFSTFLDDEVSLTGGGKTTVRRHIEERIQTYNFYRQKFSPTQIQNLKEDEFHYFLTPSGNKSWTNLQRACKQATSEMEKLKRALLHLQKQSIPLEERLNEVSRGGELYVKGFGRNLCTGLLHIFDPDKYGVWNNRSHKVLNHLDRLPYISSNFGESYARFNSELMKFASELKTTLIHLDVFLWWFDENEIK